MFQEIISTGLEGLAVQQATKMCIVAGQKPPLWTVFGRTISMHLSYFGMKAPWIVERFSGDLLAYSGTSSDTGERAVDATGVLEGKTSTHVAGFGTIPFTYTEWNAYVQYFFSQVWLPTVDLRKGTPDGFARVAAKVLTAAGFNVHPPGFLDPGSTNGSPFDSGDDFDSFRDSKRG